MRQLLLIALRNLRMNLKRSLLLGSAICAVTALLVLLQSVSHGIQQTMLRAATTLATGHVNVGGFYKVTSGQAAPVVTQFHAVKQLVRDKVPEAQLVVDRLRGWGKVIRPGATIQASLTGVDITSEPALSRVLTIVAGNLEHLARPKSVVLFSKQAAKLEVRVGDQVTISAPTIRGANNALDVQVVAIAKELGLLSSFNIFTNKDSVREIYLFDKHTTGAVQVYLADERSAGRVAERLRRLLSDAGHRLLEPQSDPFWRKFPIVTREEWTGQKLDVTTWRDEMSMLTWVITAFDVLTAVVISVLLVIIVVGVMNAMWIAIRERTREVGTLRAIGMSRSRVLLMFLTESGTLALLATSAGALIGVAGAMLLDAVGIALSSGFSVFLMSDTLRLVVQPLSVLQALALITGITTLFSLYPAYRAARLRPVTAMHHVG